MVQIQTDEELHNCPNCGGKIRLKHARPSSELSQGWIDWVRLECEECGSYTPNWYAGESEAIRAWKLITDPPEADTKPEKPSLKPCPKCGGEGKLTPYVDKYDGQLVGYRVRCETCGARTYVCSCETPAICDWNTGYVITR